MAGLYAKFAFKIAIIIAHDNYSSRKGVENAGFKLAGEFILKRFLGIAFGIKKINKQDD